MVGQDVIVANSSYNILYLGIDNPIDFASKTIKQKELLLTAKSGEIRNYQGSYFYRNCSNQPGAIVIYAHNARTKRLIDSVEFRLKRLPDPRVTISASGMFEGGYKGEDILKDIYGVRCYYSDDLTDQPCKIIGFTMTISHPSGSSKEIYVNGSQISSDLKAELASIILDGDSVIINDFKIIVGCVKESRLVKNLIKIK